MNVTENDVSLYGFAAEEQRDCFKMLTGVTGVGPKAALSILSIMTPEKIALAASSGDHKAFTKAAGVGPKLGPAHHAGIEGQRSARGWPRARASPAMFAPAPPALRPRRRARRARQPGLCAVGRCRRRGPASTRPLSVQGDHHHRAAQSVARVTEGECRIEPGIHLGPQPSQRPDEAPRRHGGSQPAPENPGRLRRSGEGQGNLKVYLRAAQRRGASRWTTSCLYGPPGLGKLTLAGIVAQEMGVQIRITSGPAIEARRFGRPADEPAGGRHPSLSTRSTACRVRSKKSCTQLSRISRWTS